jgi:hypothetical protein
MTELRLTLEGADAEAGLEELADHLAHEPELRGLVRLSVRPPSPGELGAVADALEISPTDARGAAAVLNVLKVYFAQSRRSQVRILISDQDGSIVRLEAPLAAEVEEFVYEVLQAGEIGDRDISTSGKTAVMSRRAPAEPLADTSPKLLVYLDTYDPAKVDAVQAALEQLLASADLEMDLTFGPVISSWLAHFKIRSKQVLRSEEVLSRVQKIEKAVEAVVLDKPMAAVNLDQAEATSKLLTSLESVHNAVMAIGSVILVKTTAPDGRSSVYVKTLTVAELRAFEANQHLMSDPQGALDHLHLLATLPPA